MGNHPVHILNNKGDFSSSSFIPFCAFGKDLIGVEVDPFDIPLCDIFKPRNYLDQLCYETDLQELIVDSRKIEKQLEMGLTLVLDYNEERQLNVKMKNDTHELKEIYKDDGDSVSIYINAISM